MMPSLQQLMGQQSATGRQFRTVRTLVVASAALGLLAAAWKLIGGAAEGLASVPGTHAAKPDTVLSRQPRLGDPGGFRPVTPQEALRINAAIPIAAAANAAATPFRLEGGNATDRERAVTCLTSAIYYEAARESHDGQRAVAQVVLNRVRHPGYPNSICGVVFEGQERLTGCQFSFTCDGSRLRLPAESYWSQSRRIAEAALSGSVFRPVGWATHFHADYVVPYWSTGFIKIASIGSHIFYRWKGEWGQPAAFRDRYAGIEPDLSSQWRRAVVDGMTMAAREWPMGGTAGPMPTALQRAQMDGQLPGFFLPSRSPGGSVTDTRPRSGGARPQRLQWSLHVADAGSAATAAGRGSAAQSWSAAKGPEMAIQGAGPSPSADGRR